MEINVGEATSVAVLAIVSAQELPSLESSSTTTETVDAPSFKTDTVDDSTSGSIFESVLENSEENPEDLTDEIESPDASSDEESIETEALDEDALEKARDELREEIDEGEEESQEDDVMSVEEQLKELNKTIAMLEFQLESLKKLRGRGIVDLVTRAIQYSINEFFEMEDQTQKAEQDKFNNNFIDGKIDVLGREISRLKKYRSQITANLAA